MILSIVKYFDNLAGMWILFTVLAAMLQTFRNIFSKRLSLALPAKLASLCRFMFGAPLAVAALLAMAASGLSFRADWPFYMLMCTGMAAFQLLANILLIELFKQKNFAVAMTLIKTEAIILAILGVLFLGEFPSTTGWIGIIVATAGLILAGTGKFAGKIFTKQRQKSFFSKTTLLAFGAGASLAICSIFLKKAYLYIDSDSGIMKVTASLAVIMSLQTVFSVFLLSRKERRQFSKIFKMPGSAVLAGVFALFGSFCWFTAFIMELAAYVRTLGQVEFIFGLLASIFLFHEKTGKIELAGMAGVIVGSILLVQA